MYSGQRSILSSVGRAWVALCLILLSGRVIGTELQSGARVVNGDTVVVEGQILRLAGVVAPAPGQPCFSPMEWPCGDRSLEALARLTHEHTVRCLVTESSATMPYASCWLGALDLNSWVVAQGWGFALNTLGPYAQLQTQAVASERGRWAGQFNPTAAWKTWAVEKRSADNSACSACSARKQSIKNNQ